MIKKSIFLAAAFALSASIAAPAMADNGVCVKPWFGEAKNCELGRSVDESRETSKRQAQSIAAAAAQKAKATGSSLDKERAAKANAFARSFDHSFGTHKK